MLNLFQHLKFFQEQIASPRSKNRGSQWLVFLHQL